MHSSHSANESSGAPIRLYLIKLDNVAPDSPETTAIPLRLLENNCRYETEHSISYLHTTDKSQEQIPVEKGVPKASSYLNNNQNANDGKKEKQFSVYTNESFLDIAEKSLISTNEKTSMLVRKPHEMQNYVHICDKIVPVRAIAVLPAVLQQRHNIISPRKSLSARVRFGPLQGIKKVINQAYAQELVANACQSKTPLFLMKHENGSLIHVDVSDKDKSNWLCLLPLGDQDTANLWLYKDNNELYAITTRPIGARKPLLLGYSKQYADDHGFSSNQPILDIDADIYNGVKKWWCYECQRGSPSAALLQRHIDTYHKVESKMRRHRYTCRHCTRKFSRLYTLKRHMQTSCFKKSSEKIMTPQIPIQSVATNSFSKEDSRLPSDESFNNYSNGLDFSTNLFDTDRIPGLDISSRSESEFNSFVMGYKDDHCLSNDLEFGRITGNEMKQNTTEDTQADNSIACQYCNNIIEKVTRRQHLKECTRRRFECECGRVYTNKMKLTKHICTEHSSKQPPNSSTTKTATSAYKCDKCEHSFKRRGMLVNHMWRKHKTVPTAVPLERRIRYYLCVECPKMYRTAAKRDRHIRLHHPGVKKVCGQTIDGAIRVCEPAACSACPRQYATRAKLLQHMRLHHPHLMAAERPPVSKASEMDKPCTAEETDRNQIALQQLLSIY